MAIRVLSENPNETAGKAKEPIKEHSYPLNEILSSATKLKFVKYNRFSTEGTGKEDTTAIITLPLPITVPENYSIRTTGQHDLGMFGNITNENWDKLKGLNSTNSLEDMEEMNKLGIAAAASLIRSRRFSGPTALGGLGAALASSDMKNTISSFIGLVRNPHTTVIFDGVNLRNINLEWRFSPRSEEESRALRSLYNTIKLCVHPEEVAAGFSLNYPDLVYVEFTGPAADYLPKFQKAFVSNINITPDSTGGMSLYKSGAPTTYNFQISATELSILTRNTLAEQMGGTR